MAAPAAGGAESSSTFDVAAIHADAFELAKYRSEFVRLAKEREDLALEVYTEMLGRIDLRRESENKFGFWLEDNNIQFL